MSQRTYLTNADFSRMFYETADMLELKDENVFKINALRKAARTIETLSSPVVDLYNSGELAALPGIGKGVLERVDQILQTGTTKELASLKKEIPPDLMDMMKIPHMGPKTVQLVWKQLKIITMDALEKAARGHALQGLFRLGPKQEENILKGIQLVRRGKEHILLSEALALAEKVVEELKTLKAVQSISFCGSVRRFKEIIGDVDILVASAQSKKIMEAFTALPFVGDVIAKGETKSSVRTEAGFQLDLRVVKKDEFGAALQYFTGSKEHNVALRERAGKMGLKISEYGVFKGDKKVAGETEEGVYAAVKLPWITPELRENLGEIEAAEENKLPALVSFTDILGDLHCHTDETDGDFPLEDMAEHAFKKGYRYVAITDHSQALKFARGLDAPRLRAQMKKIKALNEKYKKKNFTIFSGIECDILSDGSMDLPDGVLKECDVVIGSVHSKFSLKRDEMTERIVRAMKNPHVDMIGHLTGRLIDKRDPYELDMEQVFKTAAETKTAIEINAHPERLDLKDVYVRAAKKCGVVFFVNTDAHQTAQFDCMRYGVAQARRGWLEKKDVLNSRGTDELNAWLLKREK